MTSRMPSIYVSRLEGMAPIFPTTTTSSAMSDEKKLDDLNDVHVEGVDLEHGRASLDSKAMADHKVQVVVEAEHQFT